METAGYICRFLSHDNTDGLTLFIVQTLTILVAPALFAASVYMVLGRLIRLVEGEAYSSIRPSILTKIFVGGDILSFLIQIAGSGFLSSNFSLGQGIILAGLAAQMVFFGVFIITTTVFHRRLSRNTTSMAKRLDENSPSFTWKNVICVIYVVSAMIFVRSLFRLVEFTGTTNSPMMKTEAYLYICDSTLMFIVLAILIYWHPVKYAEKCEGNMETYSEELL